MATSSALPSWVLISLGFATLFLQSCSGGGGEPQQAPAAPTIKSITIFPSSASLKPGDTQQYTAVVRDSNNNIRKNVTVLWSTGDAAVATIDTNGFLTAHGNGTTTIQANTGVIKSQRASVSVMVDPVSLLAPLPPWMSYCHDICDQFTPVVVALCPSDNPGCTPSRSTTVIPQVNGEPVVSAVVQLIKDRTRGGLVFPDATVRLVSGFDAQVFHSVVLAYSAAQIEVRSELNPLISFYGVPPVWGGETALNFVTTKQESPGLTTLFYRHQSYDTGNAAAIMHNQTREIIRIERELTGITPAEPITLYVLPTDLTAN